MIIYFTTIAVTYVLHLTISAYRFHKKRLKVSKAYGVLVDKA